MAHAVVPSVLIPNSCWLTIKDKLLGFVLLSRPQKPGGLQSGHNGLELSSISWSVRRSQRLVANLRIFSLAYSPYIYMKQNLQV